MLMPYMLTLWAFSVLKPMTTHLRSLIILSAPGVGGVHGDMVRNVTGQNGMYSDGDAVPPATSAMYVVKNGYGYQGVNGAWRSYTYLDISRVVPTGAANKPRAWGALACCYLGTPTS